MKINFKKFILPACLILGALLPIQSSRAEEPHKLKALIINGPNPFHDPPRTTPVLKAALESSGLFTVDVVTTPDNEKDMQGFKPVFTNYNVVVLNYNGPDWPAATKTAFEEFVRNGGGFVSFHSADNAFPDWVEYNKMTGVGGWRGRSDKSGVMLRWRDGKVVRETGGGGGTHGRFFAFIVEIRDPEHPITRGLPLEWLHTRDELYCTLVGPAENVTVLATARSDVTGQNEPVLMTINYGKGRVFHTTLGHNVESIEDAGFVTTFDRGAEWAATGKVTQKIPGDFPSAEKTSIWMPPAK